MSIGIGIPVFNDFVLTDYLLKSIELYTPELDEIKIVVLDDGSTDDYRDALKRICQNHKVEFISNSKNSGVAKSWNRIVHFLKTDNMILLNNDIFVYNGWFRVLRYFLENNQNVGTVGLPTLNITQEDVFRLALALEPGKRTVDILNPWTKARRIGVTNIPELRPPVRSMSPFGFGCCFGFSRKAYDLVHGFNEEYYAFYEEVDFGIALYQQGMSSFILPSPHIYHVWGATFQRNQQINAAKVMEESRRIFINKYGCDQQDIFKRSNHNFESEITYLDGDKPKSITITETYPPGDIEW